MRLSRPTRARGLKHFYLSEVEVLEASRPTRARGLKLGCQSGMRRGRLSRPTRARGLKQVPGEDGLRVTASRPTRARGLKLATQLLREYATRVAPHAGAWIETGTPCGQPSLAAGRAPRGRVD